MEERDASNHESMEETENGSLSLSQENTNSSKGSYIAEK